MARRPAAAWCAACAALIALDGGCDRRPVDESPVVAKVGDEVLTSAQLEMSLGGAAGEGAADAGRWDAAERWVNRQLLYREAVRRGVDTRPEVRLYVQAATRELVINAMLEDLFREELTITGDEIERYYEEHRGLFRRPETTVHLKQIVVEGRTEARRIIRTLRDEPEQFEDIARRRSTDASSADGGDLGYVSATRAYSAEIWQEAMRLSEGQVSSSPVKSDAGYHVLKLVAIRPVGSLKEIEGVRPEIVNRVRAATRWAIITELVERLKLQEPYVLYQDHLGPRRIPYVAGQDTMGMIDELDTVD